MQFQNGNIIVEKALAHESILTIIRNEWAERRSMMLSSVHYECMYGPGIIEVVRNMILV